MENQDKVFMQEAIRLAIEGMQQGLGGPFGALVVKEGQIIGRGSNRVTSSNDPTAHAEVVAIRAACEHLGDFQLKGCTIYTSCEPCPMCLGAIYWARPERVVYACTREDAASIGFDDDFIYQEIPLAPQERLIPMQACLRQEAWEAFRLWQEKANRIEY